MDIICEAWAVNRTSNTLTPVIVIFQCNYGVWSVCKGKQWNWSCVFPLQWRHNERDGVSNHQPHDCLLNRFSGADQRTLQSSALPAFVRGIHRWPVNSPHKWPVTRKMFPFDDVIMHRKLCCLWLKAWYRFEGEGVGLNRNISSYQYSYSHYKIQTVSYLKKSLYNRTGPDRHNNKAFGLSAQLFFLASVIHRSIVACNRAI